MIFSSLLSIFFLSVTHIFQMSYFLVWSFLFLTFLSWSLLFLFCPSMPLLSVSFLLPSYHVFTFRELFLFSILAIELDSCFRDPISFPVSFNILIILFLKFSFPWIDYISFRLLPSLCVFTGLFVLDSIFHISGFPLMFVRPCLTAHD